MLPHRLRRVIAIICALASVLTLRSLAAGESVQTAQIGWEPLTLFRMGLALEPHPLSLLTGMILAGLVAAGSLALGSRERDDERMPWHGLVLLALAGCLVMILAANLLTLALGSGLLALAMMVIAVWTPDASVGRSWSPLSMAVPGLAATLLLFLATLQMDARLGHASLLGRTLDEPVLLLAGAAGVLWVLTYVVKSAELPDSAITLLLPAGAGLYLLARTQALLSAPAQQIWLPAVGMALLLGGSLLAWLKGPRPGLAIQQLGFAVSFVWLLSPGRAPGTLPWPSVTLTLALGILAIAWDAERGPVPPGRPPAWQAPDWLRDRVQPRWSRLMVWVQTHTAFLERWRCSWAGRHQAAIGPAIALASIVGLPLTTGAAARWRFYGQILNRGQGLLLLLAMAADVLLSASIWTALRTSIQTAPHRRVRAASQISMIVLALPLLLWGLAPGTLARGSGLTAAQAPDVSPWGLGLLYILPWLVGAWLAYNTAHWSDRLERLRRLTQSDWPYRAATWVGSRLVAGGYWLGQVGEGEGWWGWALILLALGALFLTAR
jgi:hypothetical protein